MIKQVRNGWGQAMGWAILLAALLTACGGGSRTGTGIEIKDAWVRAVQMGSSSMSGGGMSTPGAGMGGEMQGGLGNGAAYMVLVNRGATSDRLLRAESDVAGAVELHLSEMKNDVMTMRPVEAIDVPAGGQAELKPGGYHIMLIGLARTLKPGDKVVFSLVFEKAGVLKVEAEVRAP